jgi:Helix-turn-helix domain of resolvase/Resolvase, N terminal domain
VLNNAFTVIFTQAARAELIEAQDWYEGEAPGLGRRFREGIDTLAERMSANPRQFPVVFKSVRRALAVSIASVSDWNLTPRARRSSSIVIRSRRLRPSRPSFHTMSVSPCSSFFRQRSRAGRFVVATGRAMWQMIGVLAELERSLISERTRAGVKAAQRRGVKFGRKLKLTPEQIEHTRKLIDKGEAQQYVADLLNVGRSTLYRALN